MPAPNKRFAASGGVARPKISANLQVLHPAQAFVKPPPSQIRRPVVCKRDRAVRNSADFGST